MSTYGISLDDFQKIYDFQKGLCAVCGRSLEGCRIEVDHQHGTKLSKRQTVRGLLCGGRFAGCNRKLGRIDKSDWLRGALNYILNPPGYLVLK